MSGIGGRWRLVAAVGAVALLITACGSSKSKTSSPTTVSAPTTATAAPTTAAVSGTPYKLMWTEALSSGGDKYVAAIEKGVDARGGIGGHPLQIVVCVDNFVASQATQCARQAVADPNMLGIISNSSTCSSQLLPILAKAKMASIGDQFICPEDYTSAQVFPFASGSLGNATASALGVKYFHDPNVVLTTIDVPAGVEAGSVLQSIVAPAGGKVVAKVYIPLTSADMAPYAAQIAAHPGVLFEGLTVSVGVRLAQALKEIGYNQPIIYQSTSWYPSLLKSTGNPTNAYITEFYNQSSPGWQMFLSDMNQYEPGVTYQGGDLVEAWMAANVLAEIAKSLPTVSAQSIFSYLSTATDLSTFGMTQPLNFTVPQTALKGSIPRAANPDIALYHLVNGTLVQVTPFQDVFP